jgi:hypothetical protein
MVYDSDYLKRMLEEIGRIKADDDLWVFDKNIGKKYFCTNFPSKLDFFHYLTIKANGIKNLDYIIIDNIDDYMFDEPEKFSIFVETLKRFVNTTNICVIAGSNSRHGLKPNEIEIHDFTRTMTKGMVADFVLGLRIYTPNILQKIIGISYNTIFSILKNRSGVQGVKCVAKIDEDKLNMKIIKNISGGKSV